MSAMSPVCWEAWADLVTGQVDVSLERLPRQSTQTFIPLSLVRKVIEDYGRRIFSCTCENCQRHFEAAKPPKTRVDYFDEPELTKTYLRTFGLLIYLHCPGLILAFQERQIYLNDGPLLDKNLTFLNEIGLKEKEVYAIRTQFIEKQWWFLVAQLDIRKIPTKLEAARVLAFKNEELIGRGDFADAYSCYTCDENRGEGLKDQKFRRVVRKIFRKEYGALDFMTEWHNVPMLKGIEHLHIMPYLCAYQHGLKEEEDPVFFLVVEYAQATLEDFLGGGNSNIFRSSQDLWRQIQGVMEALEELHRNGLFHLDLKPQNLLVVDGVLKIADFGIARFIEGKSRPYEARQTAKSARIDYRQSIYAPPESVRASQQLDLFSMGGIFSETACQDISGGNSVEEYRKNRLEEDRPAYFCRSTFHYNGQVKESVKEEHTKLLALIKTGGVDGEHRPIDPWQRRFYSEDLFALFASMLTPWEDKEITTQAVVEKLTEKRILAEI